MRLIRLEVVLALSLALTPLAAEAQERGKTWRIGFLSPYSADFDKTWRAAFKLGLRNLGHVEGRNIVIHERHAQGRLERFPELAAELVRLKLDVFVVHGAPAVRAAEQATSAIPIVFAVSADPIGDRIVASLARPGGNVTGLADLHTEINAKRLELLKEVVPSLSRVAVPSIRVSPSIVPNGRISRLPRRHCV